MGSHFGTHASLDLELSLTPDGLHVSYVVAGVQVDAGAPFLDMPGDVVGVHCVDLRHSNLEIRDDSGEIPSTLKSSAPATSAGGSSGNTEVVLGRTTRGPVRVSYVARPRPVGSSLEGGHPPIGLRQGKNGASGQGRTFLLLPRLECSFRFFLRWGQSRGHVGVSSAGEGNVTFTATSVERVLDMFFMIGVVRTLHDESAMRVHTLDEWPFKDPQKFLAYCARARQSLARWFGDEPAAYHAFVRVNDYPGLSGSVVNGGIIVGCNREEVRSQDVRAFIDHESVHDWAYLDGPYEESVWFNEGLAEFLALMIPFEEKRLDVGHFLNRVNRAARLTYAGPLRRTPLARIAPNYWTDPLSQREPYLRGLFYFAQLSHALISQGSSPLRELIVDVRRRQKHGKRVDASAWDWMVRSQLDDVGTQFLRDLLLGDGQLPDPHIWGRDFDHHLQDALVVEPGFSTSCFFTKVVDTVRPGTPADGAGLEPGDRFLNLPSFYEAASGRAGRSVSLNVQRDGRVFPVRLELGTEVVKTPLWTVSQRRTQSLSMGRALGQ